MKNSGDNVFQGIHVGEQEESFVADFLASNDLATESQRAFLGDIKKFARWFTTANKERFCVQRVTTRDIADFRDCLHREQGQAVATVNRALVMVRGFFDWLVEHGHVSHNPAKVVKELKRVELAPKGMDRAQVRKLFREVEVRQDIRANAIFHLLLYSGCRIGDLVQLDLTDLMLGARSGSAEFRYGKGSKQRTVPLPLPARQALQAYLDTRPPVATNRVFVGERGPLTARGVRAICDKYSAICGFKIFPHLCRHTFSHRFMESSGNDIVALAQLLGHSNISTTARYTKRTEQELGDAADRMNY
jgi:site-specific recombinase XerD